MTRCSCWDAIEVEFAPALAGQDLSAAIDRIETSVRRKYPKIQRIYIEAKALTRTHAISGD
ncbi:MAG TPA: hypothetical protein VG456_21275 [Candidatus Sulfopaludibacter sp.]|jgi:hypothetical protein|nr:hypothetical protein [Candidatus Sulfopaludibacter sp.]